MQFHNKNELTKNYLLIRRVQKSKLKAYKNYKPN